MIGNIIFSVSLSHYYCLVFVVPSVCRCYVQLDTILGLLKNATFQYLA